MGKTPENSFLDCIGAVAADDWCASSTRVVEIELSVLSFREAVNESSGTTIFGKLGGLVTMLVLLASVSSSSSSSDDCRSTTASFCAEGQQSTPCFNNDKTS